MAEFIFMADPVKDPWNCPSCTLANEGGVTCPMCYGNRPGTWPCPLCQMINLPSRAVCREDGCGGCQPAAPRADDVWKPAGAPDDVPEDPSASLRVAIEAGNINEAERLLRLFGIGVPKEGRRPTMSCRQPDVLRRPSQCALGPRRRASKSRMRRS